MKPKANDADDDSGGGGYTTRMTVDLKVLASAKRFIFEREMARKEKRDERLDENEKRKRKVSARFNRSFSLQVA